MATSPLSKVLQYLHGALCDGAALSDGQLLATFVEHRNEDAFAALVRRHGPMVWGVCRRALSSHHDAEDAFQAAFLVLVRKAASVKPREMVANWLYGVAYQTALKARATAAKRRARERQVTEMPEPEEARQDLWHDLQPLLDQELSRLPDRYRSVIVLCDLQGKTRKEAALQLGVPEGTVAGRLARARTMLAKRLARHGLVVSGGALAAVLSQNAASAGVPASVTSSAIKVAGLFALGQAAATNAISGKVVTLTDGVIKAMLLTKLKGVLVRLSLLAVLAFAADTSWQRTSAEPAPENNDAAQAADRTHKAAKDAFKAADALQRHEGPVLLANVPAPRTGEAGPAPITTLAGHRLPVQALAFWPDGAALTSVGYFQNAAAGGPEVAVWDVAKGVPTAQRNEHLSSVPFLTLALTPGGRSLAAMQDGSVWLWEAGAPEQKRRLCEHPTPVLALAFSPDGRTLAVADHTCDATLWDVTTGRPRARCKGRAHNVSALAFTPDGATLAGGGADRVIRLWDTGTGQERGTLRGHDSFILALAFSPDGRSLASSAGDGGLKLWDVPPPGRPAGKTGSGQAERATLEIGNEVAAVAFAPDGKTLAVAAGDTVQLWDVRSGKRLANLEGQEGRVRCLAYSPSGKHLACGGSDKTVRIWHVGWYESKNQ
jgi:RNA polymerase sigma factor (sigma-70 family)